MTREGSVPRGAFVRGSILGGAVARASVKRAGNAIAEPFRSRSDRESARRQSDEATAKVLFDACSTLRGTPLKLAQVLATEQELLPESYRKQFALASHRVDPINRALVAKILRVELGEPERLFRRFEDVPFAAASLGQVHAATALNGDLLAVKLQYPGVGDGVAADLRLMRVLLGPTRLGQLFESGLGELRERLAEELDYRCEAANTAWFREHVRLSAVVVPRVYPECSTKHVIATERLAGEHMDAFLASSPPQVARDRYGQILFDLFFHSVFDLHCIHADPNLGNYLFRDDGTVGLIDFGCVRHLDEQFVDALRRFYFHQGIPSQAIELLHAALGVVYRSDVSRGELGGFLLRWTQWLLEPHRDGSFDYGQNRQYFERGFALGDEARRYVQMCEGAFLYFGRAHHGLQRLLQALGARVQTRLPRS